MKTSIRNVATIAVLGGMTLIKTLSIAAPAPLPPSRQAEVALAEGDVRIDGKKADIGRRLGAVALVETGKDSRCDIVFGGGNAVSFGPYARARIDFSSPSIALRLERGGVTSVLKKLEKIVGRAPFDISTPEAVAAVRGTSFYVWRYGHQTYVCACNGRVHFEDAMGGNKLDVAAAHHLGKIFTERNGAITVTDAGMLHHDDASVESVAKDIGYSIDWTKIDN